MTDTEQAEIRALRLEAANERAARLQAQLQAVVMQHQSLTAQFEAAKTKLEALNAEQAPPPTAD